MTGSGDWKLEADRYAVGLMRPVTTIVVVVLLFIIVVAAVIKIIQVF